MRRTWITAIIISLKWELAGQIARITVGHRVAATNKME